MRCAAGCDAPADTQPCIRAAATACALPPARRHILPQPPHRHAEARNTAAASMAAAVGAAGQPEAE
eukprot:COSAG01_NODE_12550_length_1715_cov_1.424168_1_plen_65_part_10